MRESQIRRLALLTYERLPATRRLMHAVHHLQHPPTYTGRGMTTRHAAPWGEGHDWEHVRQALEHVHRDFEHGLDQDTGISSATVDVMRWRHWTARAQLA